MQTLQPKSAATVTRTAAQPLVQRSAAAASVQARPASVRVTPARPQLSTLRVSQASDPAEKEADSTAKQVVRMSIPDRAISLVRTAAGGVYRAITGKEKEKEDLAGLKLGPRKPMPPQIARFAGTGLFRKPVKEEERDRLARIRPQPPGIQRKAEGTPNVSANLAAEIAASSTGGNPLPLSVRRFMEPRFKADFSNVRVHTGDKAAKLNRQLNAKAFAVGRNVFFGKGQFRPETDQGRELIAHELTHTIQQGAAVQRSEDVTVSTTSPEQVQRLGVSDVLDYFADKANLIPGFRMLTIVIGVNPINMSRVDRSAANILRAIVEFIPGGGLITRALDNYGVFDRAGAWVEQQIRTLGMTGDAFKQALDEFLDSLSWTDIFDLGGVWDRAKRIFSRPVNQLIDFVVGLGTGILRLIRDAILRPLAGLAQGTRGYDLLKAILGQDPITGDPYPRNADTLIGGFMKLIGQEEIWENIKRANAIARAWAWFQGALSGLMGIVRAVPGRFIDAVTSLTLADIVVLPRAFAKVAGVFLDVVGSFFSWAGAQVLSLLQIIFEVVAPAAVPYLRRAAGTFQSIIRNPIGFIGNLVRAGIQGFRQFGTRFLTHLRAGLIGWLTGTMSGAAIYIPQGLTLREIVKFVLSVLGLTWQNIRVKLVRAVGETAVRAMETGFDLVMTLVTQGPAAAWEKISEGLANLREMVMEQIMTFVRDRVVNRAIQTLVTSLNPAGAFIQAVIAIYNTIMFFVERLRQIAQVAMSFIDSISAIASGVIATAANRVEQTMAGLLTLVISFLARLAGLGRVSDAVLGIINRVRAPIDRALDRVVAWIVERGRAVMSRVLGGDPNASPQQRLDQGLNEASAAVARYAGRRVAAPVLRALLAVIRTRHRMVRLDVVPAGNVWAIEGEVNPRGHRPTPVQRLPDGSEFTVDLGTLQPGQVGSPVAGGSFSRDRRREPGYVGTVPARVSNSPGDIARMYQGQAFRGAADANRRFALVIGVNAPEDLEGEKERALPTVGLDGWSGFPVAVFRFLWTPRWKKNGAAVTVAQVRNEFAPAGADDAQTQAAKRTIRTTLVDYERSRMRQIVPIGPIRQRIHGSDYTGSFADYLRSNNKQVFIHVGDADAATLAVPPGEGIPLPSGEIVTGILALYDHLLRGYADEDVGIASTGYNFRLPEVGGAGDANALTNVANELDMRVRSAMARVNPTAVYFPEPNTILRVSGDTIEGRWGRAQAEMIDMARSLLARHPGAGQIFVTRGAVTTEAGRFTLSRGGGGTATAVVARLGTLTAEELTQMFHQAQSHANRRAWVSAIMRSDPGRLAVDAVEMADRVPRLAAAARVEGVVGTVYDRFFPNAIWGFEPAVLARRLPGYDAYGIRPPRTSTLRDQAAVIVETARRSGTAVAAYLRGILPPPQRGRRR